VIYKPHINRVKADKINGDAPFSRNLALFLVFAVLLFVMMLLVRNLNDAGKGSPVYNGTTGSFFLGPELTSNESSSTYIANNWIYVPNITSEDVKNGNITINNYKNYTYASDVTIQNTWNGWFDYDNNAQWHNRDDDFKYKSFEMPDGEETYSSAYIAHFDCTQPLDYVYLTFHNMNGIARIYCNGNYAGSIGVNSSKYINTNAFSDYCLLWPKNGRIDLFIVVTCSDKVTNPGILSYPIIENGAASDMRISLSAGHFAIVFVLFIIGIFGGAYLIVNSSKSKRMFAVFIANLFCFILYYLVDCRFLSMYSHTRADMRFILIVVSAAVAYSMNSCFTDGIKKRNNSHILKHDRYIVDALGAALLIFYFLMDTFGSHLTSLFPALLYGLVVMLISLVKTVLRYFNERSNTLTILLCYTYFVYLIFISILMDSIVVYMLPNYSFIFVIAVIVAEITFLTEFIRQQRQLTKSAATLKRQVREKTVFISEINRDLVENNKKLVEGELARKNVLSNVSHDLRTPITAIRGYAELLLSSGKDMPDAQIISYLTNIVKRSEQMERIVSDIIELTRMEANNAEFQFTNISMSEMLDELVTMYSLDLEESTKHIELEIPNDDLLIVKADPKKISRVFENLISNAINYTEGEARIVVRAWRSNGNMALSEQQVHISVSDNGIGIPAEEVGKIFDRFYRAKNSGINIKGTGLGLAIVKLICDRHNAKIMVTSEIGKGTTFEIIMPAVN